MKLMLDPEHDLLKLTGHESSAIVGLTGTARARVMPNA